MQAHYIILQKICQMLTVSLSHTFSRVYYVRNILRAYSITDAIFIYYIIYYNINHITLLLRNKLIWAVNGFHLNSQCFYFHILSQKILPQKFLQPLFLVYLSYYLSQHIKAVSGIHSTYPNLSPNSEAVGGVWGCAEKI